MKGPFIVKRSLLGFAQFRKGGNGLICVVRFLATVVETTISGSNLSAFDMSTRDVYASEDVTPHPMNIRGLPEAAIVTLEDRLPADTPGAQVALGCQQSATEDALEWVPSYLPGLRASWG